MKWFIIGALVGAGLLLAFGLEPLCKAGVNRKAQGALDKVGLGKTNPLRGIVGDLITG